MNYIVTGVGGALVSVLRLALGQFLSASMYGMPFPILCINVLRCFIMGALTQIMPLHGLVSDQMKYFWISGFLGGFTTFSMFSLESGQHIVVCKV